MNLYRITNGYIGESYVRVYAWASNEEEALELARQSFIEENNNRTVPHPESYYNRLEIEMLFSADSAAFATNPSEAGWYIQQTETS